MGGLFMPKGASKAQRQYDTVSQYNQQVATQRQTATQAALLQQQLRSQQAASVGAEVSSPELIKRSGGGFFGAAERGTFLTGSTNGGARNTFLGG